MLNKKTVKDIQVNGKTVLVRCDFNVPLDRETSSVITSDKRIVESLKTIEYLINAGTKIVLCSHIGKTKKGLSLKPVAEKLATYLNRPIRFLNDCIGPAVDNEIANMKVGEIILLENLRNYEEEEANDENFAKSLANNIDVFVNDAFGTAHRKHASTYGVTKFLPSVAGFLIDKEIQNLDNAINEPKRPLVAVIGGAKVSSKLGVLLSLINKVDTILIGGAMAYTFLKALGHETGKSIVEEDLIDKAKEIINEANEKNVKLLLPIDNIIASEISDLAETKEVMIEEIPEDKMGLDIGSQTIAIYKNEILKAETVVWNGPVGVFEVEQFGKGTREIAIALAISNGITIIGGGDTTAALEKLNLEDEMTHVSTGGGASLVFLEGKELPAIAALLDK